MESSVIEEINITQEQIILPLDSLKDFIRDSSIDSKKKPKISINIEELQKEVFSFLKKFPSEFERYKNLHAHFERYRHKHFYFADITQKLTDDISNAINKKEEIEYTFGTPGKDFSPSIFLLKKYENQVEIGIRETRKIWRKVDENIGLIDEDKDIRERTVVYNQVPTDICRFYKINLSERTAIFSIDTVGQGSSFKLKDYDELIYADLKLITGEKDLDIENHLQYKLDHKVIDAYMRLPHILLREVNEFDSKGHKSVFGIDKKRIQTLLNSAQSSNIAIQQIKENFPEYDVLHTHTGAIASENAYKKKNEEYWPNKSDIIVIFTNSKDKYDSIHLSVDASNSYLKSHEYRNERVIEDELQEISRIISRISRRR